MKLIINADDFGTNAGINRAIIEKCDAGIVTSASIIVNGHGFDEAVEYAKGQPQVSMGIHLNASCGLPTSSSSRVRDTLTRDGVFPYRCSTTKWRPAQKEALYEEWRAQIERLLNAGVRISHLDSECHVHINPQLAGLLLRLKREFNLKKIRNVKNIGLAIWPIKGIKPLISKKAWSFCYRYILGFQMTDGFSDFEAFHRAVKEGWRSRMKTVELMVHPGVGEYARETRLLEQSSSDSMMREFDRISYHDL